MSTAHKAHADCVHLYLYLCAQPARPTRTVFNCICTGVHNTQVPHGQCSPVSVPVSTAHKFHTDSVHRHLYLCTQPTRSSRTMFTFNDTCVCTVYKALTDCVHLYRYLCVHSLQGPHGLCSPLLISVCAQSTRPTRSVFICSYTHVCAQSTRPTRSVFTCSYTHVCAKTTRPTRSVFTCSYTHVCAQPTRPTRTVFTCIYTCVHSPQGPHGLCSPVAIPVCTAHKAHTDCVHIHL